MPGILQELMRTQEREGWLSEPALRELAERLGVPLHRLESVSTFYTHFRRTPPRGAELSVCRDVACSMAGGATACARLRDALAGRSDVEVREVSCLGRCDTAPAAALGERTFDLGDTAHVLSALEAAGDEPPARAPRSWAADPYATPGERFAALRAALGRDPRELVAVLEESGLRGMGGAGFPTGRKWGFVAAEAATAKFVICNADESEPATFKDREILHDLSHLVIEGMALAAYCTGATRGFLFIRHEYAPERHRFEAALAEARRAGALGPRVFGSDFAFDVEIFVSPGGYILGEETALLECMEDRRGEPRNKPPFPGRVGLHGQPTLVNNVETLAHSVGILLHGAEWWRSRGRPGFAGHKFMSVCGDVERPGVVLVPFGTTLGELLEACGGMRGGAALAAVAPGGASSHFLPAASLDVPIDFDAISAAGSMLGSGAALFVAAGRDLLDVGLDVTRFFRNESCGKCVPCRIGTEKAVKLVESGAGVSPESEALLRRLDATLRQTSLCGLGQVALSPLLSVLAGLPDRVGRPG
jgi:NADH:ubiquinone oxidoreductase subunit F (NADH-binding)/NADH:ubiquinone oxidoreductase subunit E